MGHREHREHREGKKQNKHLNFADGSAKFLSVCSVISVAARLTEE